jgi:hypothetical protein
VVQCLILNQEMYSSINELDNNQNRSLWVRLYDE